MNDKKEFDELCDAMKTLNIGDSQSVFAVLSSLLWLGNVAYVQNDDATSIAPTGLSPLKNASELLGLDMVC